MAVVVEVDLDIFPSLVAGAGGSCVVAFVCDAAIFLVFLRDVAGDPDLVSNKGVLDLVSEKRPDEFFGWEVVELWDFLDDTATSSSVKIAVSRCFGVSFLDAASGMDLFKISTFGRLLDVSLVSL